MSKRLKLHMFNFLASRLRRDLKVYNNFELQYEALVTHAVTGPLSS